MNYYKIILGLLLVIVGQFHKSIVYAGYCNQADSCTGTCYRSIVTYTDCGLFWWSSCTEYKPQSYSCSKTCYRLVCCPGYTGSDCDTPLCDGSTSCPNGGTCQSPDSCSCPRGYSTPRCNDINECASSSHGCQHSCSNTPGSYYCMCNARYVLSSDLKTCIVDCGHPGSIEHGTVAVVSTNYEGTASYTCDTNYFMSSGDRIRRCQNDFAWSGTEPVCTFANHCGSVPCKNGATCENLVDEFRCDCAPGWSGHLCDDDIQPPVMTGCGDDVTVYATEHTVLYNWTKPTFIDPMGSDLSIFSNYNSSVFIFPWGNHIVQYVATKTTNGMVTECTFQIKVRPTPCEELNVPVNGARLCNGWKTDYGRFCMIMCQQNYTLGPSYSYHTWYVCGASGTWIAANPAPDCGVQIESNIEAEYYQPEYSDYVILQSCKDDVTRDLLRNQYIENLKGMGGFSSFCSTYEDECIKENVDVQCSD